MRKGQLWTAPFLSMCGGSVSLFMSQSILMAVLPIYIIELGGGDIEAGLAMTCFQIGTMVCRPIAGRIIDHINKRNLLLVSSVIFVLVMIGFFLQNSLKAIYALRVVHGAVFALFTTAAAALAVLVTPPKLRGDGVAYYALSTNVALVVGPLLGLILIQEWGSACVFLFLVAMALGTLAAVYKTPFSQDVIVPQKEKGGNFFSLSNFVEYKALMASLLGGLVYFSYGAMLTFISLYTRTLGLGRETTIFFLAFAIAIIVPRPFIDRVFDQKGPNWVIYPGFLCFLAGMILFSLIVGPITLYLSGILLGLGFGALAPAFQTLAVANAPSSRAGVASATFLWATDISVGIAAATLGVIAADRGFPFVYGPISSGVIAVACVIYFGWNRIENIGAKKK
jgi:predicted MFS family arabinose efflux permease